MNITLNLTAEQLDSLREALAHLQVAEGQSVPSDDQIIIGHVRDAIAIIRPIAWPKR